MPSVLTVPTVPPGNVQTEATNSTTIRFTRNPPSPQFINGINQGYKVRSYLQVSLNSVQQEAPWPTHTAQRDSSLQPPPANLMDSSPTVKAIFTEI